MSGCSTANGCNDEQKALKLPTLLERGALALVITDQEQTAAVQVQRAEVQQLQDQITVLTEQVAALTTRTQRLRMVRCFECN